MTLEEQQSFLHELYQQYYRDVYRYVRYLMGNHEDALDGVQEVFVRAFHSIDTFEGRSNPKTWLLAIARNYSADWFRKQGDLKKTQQDLVDRMHTMSDPAASVETKVVIEHALHQLKPTYRQVFILRYMLDMSVKDTAEILHWSDGKVRTTLHRSTLELRKLLTWQDSEGGDSNDIR